MIEIIIPEIFTSVNLMYGAIRYGKTTMPRLRLTLDAKAYKEAVAWEAKMTYKGEIITEPVQVSIWYYFKDKRRRDIQNDKLTLDALEGIVIKDDSQVYILNLYKRFNKQYPHTKIHIKKLWIKKRVQGDIVKKSGGTEITTSQKKNTPK